MPSVIVVGAQWGDEGKGKVVDLFAERADMVVRFGGGANAGHTLSVNGQKLITHLIPSGVLHPGTRCVLGDGMVIDPDTLLDEIARCQERGLLKKGELLIGEGAHVVMPYHKTIEALREARFAIGTTRRGIGPAYEAKMARRGIRVGDLAFRSRVKELVELNLAELGPLITHYGGNAPSTSEVAAMIDSVCAAGSRLLPYVGRAGAEVSKAARAGQAVLFEGAQGALLDIDHGTYPFVTSSATIASGACQGIGVGPTTIDAVIGITKAYCTRVGSGPFPTEMEEAEGEVWRRAGQEFGATTGRPRRCGWLDVPALRLAARLSGLGGLALTKLDVLGGRERIRVCVGYEIDGERCDDELPPLTSNQKVVPVYREFEPWSEDVRAARSITDLPRAARSYLEAVESLVGVPFCLISVGPNRDDTIELKDVFSM